jgi:hypothetical protein
MGRCSFQRHYGYRNWIERDDTADRTILRIHINMDIYVV